MSRKTKWHPSYAMYQVSNQSWIMRKMSMQVVNLFSSSPFFQSEQVNQVYSLKKAIPAITGGIAFIDPIVRRDIKQGTQVSFEMQPGYLSVLI
jgi:hypothetical protein